MAHVLRMPAVLAGADEAVLLSWHVKAGDTFAAGDPLAEVETEKALVDLAAEEGGTLGRALASDGQKVSVGDPIAVLVVDGDTEADIEAALATAGDFAEAVADTVRPVEPTGDRDVPVAGQDVPAAAPAGRVFMSPLVRRLGRELGIDLTSVSGTGPRGRIVRRDLDAFVAGTRAAQQSPQVTPADQPTSAVSAFEDLPHSGMRRAIARRLTESKTTVPHFYLTAELRVDRLLGLRAEANTVAGVHLSVNDLLVKAAAAAFGRVPEANVIWTEAALRRLRDVDIAVAVSTDQGLVTPVVRNVAALSLTEISSTVADLAERARSRRLHQHELEGGSFSISNLGMYGTREFSAILNPPQSGILAVGATRDGVVVEDGRVGVAKVMTVTLSVDHRAVDGALAATWLEAFRTIVENPVTMLL